MLVALLIFSYGASFLLAYILWARHFLAHTPIEFGKKWGSWCIAISPVLAYHAAARVNSLSEYIPALLILAVTWGSIGFVLGFLRGKIFPPRLDNYQAPPPTSDDDYFKQVAEENAYARAADELETNQADKATNATADRYAHGSDEASDGDVAALYEAVIGEKNTSYYLTKFEKFDQQDPGLKASWNWPAFFFNLTWALYRKMYGWFFVLLGVYFVSSMVDTAGAPGFGFFVLLTPYVAFGFFANSLYYNNIQRRIAAALLAFRDEPKLLAHLRNKGGVNTWVIWVSIAILVIGILAAIVIPARQALTTSIPNQQTLPNSNAAPVAPSPEVAPQVIDLYGQMQALYDSRQFEQLAGLVNTHLKQNPNDPAVLNYGGLVLSAVGNFEGARLYYADAISLSPKDSVLYYNLASTYPLDSASQQRINILEAAHKIDSNSNLVNGALSEAREYARKMKAERQTEARYRKQATSNGSNSVVSPCIFKGVMTDEEIRACK